MRNQTARCVRFRTTSAQYRTNCASQKHALVCDEDTHNNRRFSILGEKIVRCPNLDPQSTPKLGPEPIEPDYQFYDGTQNAFDSLIKFQTIGRQQMICNQLSEATSVFAKIYPQPSMQDVTRAVCGNCDRIDRCPNIDLDHVEVLEKKSSQDGETR